MSCRNRQIGLLVALLLAGSARADDSPAAPKQQPQSPALGESVSAPAVGPPASPALPPHDFWYLWGEDGRPVPVLDKPRLAEYLKWRDRARKNPIPYNIAAIACTGTADTEQLQRDVVHLAVRLEIQTTSTEWVLVPLKMAEATLLDVPRYEGAGEARPVAIDGDTEYACWIRGQDTRNGGRHQLTLHLSVPARKQAAGRRIQLSLPPTAVSSLKLRLPQPRITAKAAEQKPKVTVTSENGSSEITVIGLGNRLDLSWQASPETAISETALEIATSISAALVESERMATFEVTQNIRSLEQQGTFDSVRVSIPPGGEIVRVDCPEYERHESDPRRPHEVVVKLKRPTTGPFDLRWTIRAPLPAVGEPFSLEGFEVDRARIHTGYLAVAVVGDFRLSSVTGDTTGGRPAQRINVSELPPVMRQARVRTAYRFLNRLHLRLRLQRVVPYMTAAPEAWLQVSPQELQFTATYPMQISGGSLSEVSLRWPGWIDEGWNIESLEGSDESSENLAPQLVDHAAAHERLRIEFTQPPQGRKLQLRIRARRILSPGAGAVPFSLPMIEASAQSSLLLAVLCQNNLEVELDAAHETVVRPRTDTAPHVFVPRELTKLHRADYRIDSPEATFTTSISLHPLKIGTTTFVEASPSPGLITVRQKIEYEVAFGTLSEARFQLPRGLTRRQLRIADPEGAQLPTHARDDSSEREVVAPFAAPRTGRFALDLRYSFEAPDPGASDREQEVTIPLVTSEDAACDGTQFQWRDTAGRDATVTGSDWTRFPDADGLWTWTLPRAAREITLVRARAAGGVSVTRALIRTQVGLDGTIHTISQYRLSGAAQDLLVTLRPGVQPVAVWWDRQKIKLPLPRVDESGESRYQFVPVRSPGSRPVLTIETTTPGALLSRFTGQLRLTAPQLPNDLPVLECQWQVTLPGARHLFSDPDGFAAEYRWLPYGIFWSRYPNRTSDELETWIGEAPPLAVPANPDSGNVYLFGRAGSAEIMRLRVMSQSGIVLIGASTALFLGWLLVTWPKTRHVLTLLLAGFLVALLAVWFTAPVLVLLQPAMLGVVLAVVAAAIDSYRTRKSPRVTVALNPQSGFTASSSSVPRGAAATVGSNEFTSLRAPAPSSVATIDPTGQLSESGSRS